MRRNLLQTTLLIGLMILLLAPLAQYLSDIQDDAFANDAAHTVEPLIRLYSQSPAHRADMPVAPVMNIEEIWEIEDFRSEAEQPLVAGMRNGNSVLGYDAGSQTFYCTIGLNLTDDVWPELQLFVQSAHPDTAVSAVFVDDYAYDVPSDAVSCGYRYELLAYTESHYQYFGIVFTGLPIVTLDTELPIYDEYVPACISVSSADNQPITSMGAVHRRGGGYGSKINKYSYRIELQTMSHSGRVSAQNTSVLGMETDSDWLLLANATDKQATHNYLAFDLWNRWADNKHLFMQQDSRMVELFIGKEYKGLYQLMQRVDPQKEIVQGGGDLSTDMAIRVIQPKNRSDRPICEISSIVDPRYEYLYAPLQDADKAFDTGMLYAAMNDWQETQLSDETFIQLVEKHVDVENFMSYFLFMQAAGLTWDNFENNVFIYMLQKDGELTFQIAPWDMDGSFFYGYFKNELSQDYRLVLSFTAAVRMLNLNVMNCREILHNMYKHKRETVLSDSAIEEWILRIEQEITSSGAYLRETKKWYDIETDYSLSELLEFEKTQAEIIGQFLNERWPIK